MNDVMLANNRVNKAALGLTLHRQTIASFPSFFIYLARILILVCAGYLASKGIDNPVGTIAISFAATASLSSSFSLTFVVQVFWKLMALQNVFLRSRYIA